MDAHKLPPISSLQSRPTDELIDVLDHLFEPSLSLHTLSLGLLRNEVFRSYDELIASVGVQLTDLADSTSTSDTKWLESILVSHPRLGEKKIESTQSQAEQAQLHSGNTSDEAKLLDMNTLYERTFPGLRFVVFVDGRNRSVILDNMKCRVDRGDIARERTDAIKAMCEIAADRARKSNDNDMST